MKISIRTTWSLVWPFLKHRVPALLGVVVLGFLASIGPTAILFLLHPLWKYVLFPGQEVALPDQVGVGTSDLITSSFERLFNWAADLRGIEV